MLPLKKLNGLKRQKESRSMTTMKTQGSSTKFVPLEEEEIKSQASTIRMATVITQMMISKKPS